MKKTLIALALAATAVSGSAMAWTASGTGGNVELGGNIQITPYDTPWEVMVGGPVTGLNANIAKGAKAVAIPVTKAIPVLGIRTTTNAVFQGRSGISPQIDFHGAIDITKFTQSVTTLTLDVKDGADAKIGVMTAPLSAMGVTSQVQTDVPTNTYQFPLITQTILSAFKGGIPDDSTKTIRSTSAVKSVLNSISPDFLANYNNQGVADKDDTAGSLDFSNRFYISAAYGAGIVAGKNINITLNTPAASDAIQWKASMPVTVSYQ